MVCVPHLSHTCSCIAFPLLRISHLCVFCDILSPKAVPCPFFRPKMFSLGDRVWYHSRTLGAHVLATVVGPSPNGLQFCHIWCMGSLKWIMRVESVLFSYPEIIYCSFGPPITSVLHESCWQSITAKVASLVFCLLASVEGTTVCLEIPPPPPPGGRPPLGNRLPPSRAMGGDFKGGEGTRLTDPGWCPSPTWFSSIPSRLHMYRPPCPTKSSVQTVFFEDLIN